MTTPRSPGTSHRHPRWWLVALVAIPLAAAGCSAPEDNRSAPAPTVEVPRPVPDHWSFKHAPAVTPPDAHSLSVPEWVKNEVDAFVLAKLDAAGLAPSPPASPDTLLRRVTLALTGLPPTLEELDAFLADPSDAAYSAAVDRLLTSPRYAEHMATAWLDLARYADTDGFQYDLERPGWQWRDWVVEALHDNMPYDEFTTLQLAGDLVPNPTPESFLATSFNRNHSIQDENGLVVNEYRDVYVSDRVETLGKVWLGLTVGCARCHDHKYDPTTAKDFFTLYDCFNQIDEKDAGFLSQFTPTMQLDSPLKDSVLADLAARINTMSHEPSQINNVAELQWDQRRTEHLADIRVMTDMPVKRPTQVLTGGRYDAPTGPTLSCGAPGFLPPFPAGAPANRLGLAQWVMMPDNPLTHRVTANRMWAQFFGAGLVPSVDNFGVLTEAPVHRDLLEWLSQEFVRSGFSVKAFHRRLVLSATFRQISDASDAALAADLSNRYLGRGPRYRLGAEAIRDIPLFVSGLLVERVGGPPTYPYQPPGLWEPLGWEDMPLSYPVLSGDGLFRRSLYTFWKRTLPPVFLSIFDAPSRESSTATRTPDTSPQQALALLNDPSIIQAARALSNTLLTAYPADIDGAIRDGFRRLTSRFASEAEMTTLRSVYDAQLGQLPSQTLGIAAESGTEEQVFALSQVLRVLFNLNETISLE